MQKTQNQSKNAIIATVKFLPLIVFAVMVIAFKLDLLIAAPIATFVAILVFMFLYKSNFDGAFEKCLTSAKKIVTVFFILMFAYGVAESFMATGVGASLINLALELGVTARTIAPVALVVTCLLSTATGTSWGTFAACAPIFLWLNHLVGGDIFLTICSIAGGSCFGDNIGMISDVTVLSCGMQDVKIIDRFKHQLVWALSCLLLALIIVFFAGINLPNVQGDVHTAISQIPQEALDALAVERPSALVLLEQVQSGVSYFMVIPLIVVIALSFTGMHTMICLGAGMISSLILGLIFGTLPNLSYFLTDIVYVGFSDAGSWVIVMMIWIASFGGIMNAMNAFEPLTKFIVKISRNVNQLLGWCGVMSLVGNVALADETAQVTTISPIVRDVVEKNVTCKDEKTAYALRLRLSTFTSAMGIYGSQLIPWHCFPVFFAGIASAVYPLMTFTPLDFIAHNYLSFIVVGSLLLLTFTSLDRFVPMFKISGIKDATLNKGKDIKSEENINQESV